MAGTGRRPHSRGSAWWSYQSLHGVGPGPPWSPPGSDTARRKLGSAVKWVGPAHGGLLRQSRRFDSVLIYNRMRLTRIAEKAHGAPVWMTARGDDVGTKEEGLEGCAARKWRPAAESVGTGCRHTPFWVCVAPSLRVHYWLTGWLACGRFLWQAWALNRCKAILDGRRRQDRQRLRRAGQAAADPLDAYTKHH